VQPLKNFPAFMEPEGRKQKEKVCIAVESISVTPASYSEARFSSWTQSVLCFAPANQMMRHCALK
jgi:hypothetical protein